MNETMIGASQSELTALSTKLTTLSSQLGTHQATNITIYFNNVKKTWCSQTSKTFNGQVKTSIENITTQLNGMISDLNKTYNEWCNDYNSRNVNKVSWTDVPSVSIDASQLANVPLNFEGGDYTGFDPAGFTDFVTAFTAIKTEFSKMINDMATDLANSKPFSMHDNSALSTAMASVASSSDTTLNNLKTKFDEAVEGEKSSYVAMQSGHTVSVSSN